MLTGQDYSNRRSSLVRFADEILALELIWPFPLIGIGVLEILDPLMIGVAIILALMPWLARWLVFGRPTRHAFVGGALAALVISGLVGIWSAYDPTLSWPMLLTLLGSVSLFFAIVNSAASPWQVGSGLVIAASLLALYFVAQYGYFDYGEEGGRLARLARMTGSLMPNLVLFTPHPNAVAGFLEGPFLLSLALTWRTRGGRRLVWGLATVVIAYGLLISGSRGSWVGLVVAMVIGALLLVPSRPLRLTGAGLSAAGGLVAIYLVVRLPSDRQVSVINSALNTVASRLVLYRNSLHLLGDYPFTGIGPGDTFAMVYSRYQLLIRVPFLTYAHNLLLSVGLGYGLLGLMALAWLLIGFYRLVVRVEGAGLSERSLPLFRAAWLGATVTFVHGLIDSPQFSDSRWTMPMLFALLGLVVAVGRPALMRVGKRVTAGESEGRRQGWRWIVGATLSSVLLVAAVIFWRPLGSAWYANLGAVYQTRSELSPGLDEAAREAGMVRAVAYFERALSLSLSQPVANRRLGMMALDQRDFDAAVTYLERAYPHEPRNQATLKLLGFAYLWTGQMDRAEGLLRQLDVQSELVEELGNWRWWWGTQDREDLSAHADEMIGRLSAKRR
jgi:putative inorganic carbon (HCO3(-)) transporter